MDQSRESDGKHIATDPYRPAVGATPPNETPLIVESCDKLPAENTVIIKYDMSTEIRTVEQTHK